MMRPNLLKFKIYNFGIEFELKGRYDIGIPVLRTRWVLKNNFSVDFEVILLNPFKVNAFISTYGKIQSSASILCTFIILFKGL